MAGFSDALSSLSKMASGASSLAANASKAAGQTSKLGQAAATLHGQIEPTAKSFADMAGQAQEAGGVLDMVEGALRGLGPEGQAAAEVLKVVAAAVTALVVTMWDLLRTAVAISQEKDALASTFAALASGAQDGYALVDAVSELAAKLPFAEGEVLAWGKALMAAGIQGKAMEEGVTAIASATALMGKSGGAAAETLIKRFAMAAETGAKLKLDRRMMMQLAEAGVSADTLAKKLGVDASKLSTMAVDASKLGDAFQKALIEKGAGALENMSITWASITAKLDDAWGDLFEDMGEFIKPFMTAVRDLFAELSAGSAAQSVTKSVLTSVFRTLFEWGTKAVNAIHYGFLVVEVAALRVAIAIAPFVKWLIAIYSNAMVLKGLKILLVALLTPLAAIIAFFTLMATGIAIIFAGIATGIAMITAGFAWIVGQVGNFISGIVEGITSGTGAVVTAVKGLASSALNAFKSALGIKSPSAVMRLQGQYMAAGTAQGLEAGTPSVRAAAASMAGGGAAGGAQGGGAGRGGGGITVMPGAFAPGSVVIDGAGKSAMQITEEMLTLVLERLAGTQGLVTP